MRLSALIHFEGVNKDDFFCQTKWRLCEPVFTSLNEKPTKKQVMEALMGEEIVLQEVYKAHPGVLKGKIEQREEDFMLNVSADHMTYYLKGDVLKIAHVEGVLI